MLVLFDMLEPTYTSSMQSRPFNVWQQLATSESDYFSLYINIIATFNTAHPLKRGGITNTTPPQLEDEDNIVHPLREGHKQ